MPFVAIPDTIQVDMVNSLGGQTVVWGWQWEKAGGFSMSVAESFADEIFVWWDEQIKPLLSANLTLDIIRLTDLSSSTGFVIEWTTQLPEAHTGVEPSLPGSAAAVVSFKTGNRGRAFRGRCYIPGLMETDVNVNTLTPAFITALGAAFNVSASLGTLIGADQVVASRTTDPGFTTPVIDWIVRPTVKTQKRRLP